MERGIKLEPTARFLYEAESNNEVEECGFVEFNDYVGSSPDGLVGADGIIEIKCPKDTTFLAQVIANKVKPEYHTQIQFNLYVLNRQWCDYVAYNENYPLFIKRIERDEEHITKIQEAIEECNSKIEENLRIFKSKMEGSKEIKEEPREALKDDDLIK
jgi:hypothetical protein